MFLNQTKNIDVDRSVESSTNNVTEFTVKSDRKTFVLDLRYLRI